MNTIRKYAIADFCFVRTPAFPRRLLTRVYDHENRSGKGDGAVLKEVFADARIETALHGSTSPELYAEYIKWTKGLKSSRENEKMEETLLRYLVRMTTRCVPFGLFSGFSLAELGDLTTFQLGDAAGNIAHQRLDMDYIQDICDKLKMDSAMRNAVRYFPNTSLYKVNGTIKYVEYSTDTRTRKYNYSAVAFEEYLGLVLETARGGCTPPKLVSVLLGYDPEISESEAVEYIGHLIDSQLLISELEPIVAGKDNLSRLVEIIENTGQNELYAGILKDTASLLREKQYTIEKADNIRSLIENITGPKTHWSILQVDLETSTAGDLLNRQTIEAIAGQIQNLSVFAFGVSRPALARFKARFLARYDTKEIPLVEALDPEIGIGYDTPDGGNDLILTIPFGQETPQEPIDVKSDGLAEFMTDKYIQCIQNGSSTIFLSDAELGRLRELGLDRELPENFFIHGSILAHSLQDLDTGRFKFQLRNLSGPPSCLTLGRFAYTSPKLTEKLRSCASLEQALRPEAIYAEIVHLTDPRVGNVVFRPHLREYEIEYLGNSDLDAAHKLAITDIMVSIKDNRVRLRSKKYNREIIPRLTTAHVFSNSHLPVYKFLGEVQRSEGSDWLSWHWNHLKNQRFLPRVEYKNIILKTARWIITKEDIGITSDKVPGNDPAGRLRDFALRNSIPRDLVYLEELDKEFVIDLRNLTCCNLLIREIERCGKIVVEEYLQDDTNCWIKDASGHRYPNEVMFPVVRIPAENPGAGWPLSNGNFQDIVRKFPPGSEWIYFKLYTSVQGAEKILASPLMQNLIGELKDAGSLSGWHFIRYADPDFHLRIRFKASGGTDAYLDLLHRAQAVFNHFLEKQQVYKLQLDTYEREVERYGSYTMQESEDIFTIDSTACLAFINLVDNYEEQQGRWLWALKAIDMFLDAFQYSPERKQNLMARSEQYFLQLLNGTKLTFTQINSKYKTYAREINGLLASGGDTSPLPDLLQDSMGILVNRQGDLERVASVILQSVQLHREKEPDDLVSSYIHMFINRLFTSDANKSELVLYAMLGRFFTVNRYKQHQPASRGKKTAV
ncbi:MAG TPA: lantibiotic dehydratase [Puia sp.]|nr:lantibiotic dehydratase [Puia sp.]